MNLAAFSSDGQYLPLRHAAVTPSKSREVALIANPEFEVGRVTGHRARRLIDGANPAFSDPFLLMAEDWAPRDAFSQHPHRGIETVTLVLDGALDRRSRADLGHACWLCKSRYRDLRPDAPCRGTA